MATIHATEKPIRDIFHRDYAFSIPAYQRPYSWGTEQSSTLLDDLLTASAAFVPTAKPENINPYFLGSIVVIKNESTPEAQVIDGQQRLTTLALLLSALRVNFADGKRQDTFSKLLLEEGDTLVGTRDRCRLVLRDRDHAFYEANVLRHQSLNHFAGLLAGKLSDPQRRLAENSLRLVEKVKNLSAAQRESLAAYETLDETEEEWTDEEAPLGEKRTYTAEELDQMSAEVQDLKAFQSLAQSIIKNSKGEVLLTALKRGFAAATEKGAQKKAIIFTESVRTQEYLRSQLEQTEYACKIVLFNGSNADPKSKEIYRDWLKKHAGTDRITGSPSADMRAALVDYFRDEAIVMVATEAAAEGINLQFCSLVVNYDLPFNPQKIEQRIGRCHRYGQKCDVVVVNFLNKANAADVRVYQLLDEKCQKPPAEPEA